MDPLLYIIKLTPVLACTHACTAASAPIGAGTFFGGQVVGIMGILLFEVCVWGAVKLRRRRMQKPAATEGKEGIRFVGMHFNYSAQCKAIYTRLLM